jgi:hypothetical protein
MTPLAYRIAKQATLPKHERTFTNDALLKRICAAHCFETTQVQELAHAIMPPAEKGEERHTLTVGDESIPFAGQKAINNLVSVADRIAFLPSPYTWIEWRYPDWTPDHGWLLCEDFGQTNNLRDWIGAFACCEQGCDFSMSIPKQGDPRETIMHGEGEMTDEDRLTCGVFLSAVLCNLAIINTPHIVGRTTRLPHAGLQKRLARAFNMPGKYPLQAWHELKLHVAVPPEFSGEEVEGHLTGERALHFCRSYLRIRLGQLELVHSHWRGNPALGIKQTRYMVEP